MKLLLPVFLFGFLFSFFDAKAQQPHFIYIQTENKQPFYVKMDKNIFNSTGSGYLIMSKLIDSTCSFTIGFPKNEWPQQNFKCAINKKDAGYVLKNFGDKGWGLFNFETMDIVMANSIPSANSNLVKDETTDAFSNMLSVVVHDPGIKQKKIEKPATDNDTGLSTIDTAKTEVTATAKTSDEITNFPITKILQNSNTEGEELVYTDNSAGNTDTIRIFIPLDKTGNSIQQAGEKKTIIDSSKYILSSNEKINNRDTRNSDSVNSNSLVTLKSATSPKAKLDTIAPAENKPGKMITADNKIKINSNNCRNLATDEDFLKLRKKMASSETDDGMISLAKKYFKTKCFSTKQIRNLGFLFLKDVGKYKFFDMAYSFVADPENFSSLQSELTDSYYINRFKVMIKQ